MRTKQCSTIKLSHSKSGLPKLSKREWGKVEDLARTNLVGCPAASEHRRSPEDCRTSRTDQQLRSTPLVAADEPDRRGGVTAAPTTTDPRWRERTDAVRKERGRQCYLPAPNLTPREKGGWWRCYDSAASRRRRRLPRNRREGETDTGTPQSQTDPPIVAGGEEEPEELQVPEANYETVEHGRPSPRERREQRRSARRAKAPARFGDYVSK